ncbi:MAG: protein translocase subunit SecF [Candidatus Methanoperedens sp.]|nr:protein translocase subunit SecF [Candidatus Methanoperedens sp.]
MTLNIEKIIESYVKNITLKQMIIVPAIFLLLSFFILGYTTYRTSVLVEPGMEKDCNTKVLWGYCIGSPVELGVEFKGGTAIIFDSPKTPDELKAEFHGYPVTQAREYGGQDRKMVQFGTMTESVHEELTNKVNSEYTNVEIRQMGEVVSKPLQEQAVRAIILSFLGMAIVVYIIFRTFVPSMAVVISAFADIAFAAAMMNVFGVVLSLGTVAGLLMLIGYSVDTDILLTTRLLKRKGELNEKIIGAMKTGLTMTMTTLAALVALYLVSSGSYIISSFTRIDIIRDISMVLIFGLIADIVNTWTTNLGILKWYMEKGKIKEKTIEKPKNRRQTA